MRAARLLVLPAALLLPAKGAPEDVARALEELEAKAAPLLRLKEVDWKKVRSEMTKAAAAPCRMASSTLYWRNP